MEPLRKPLTKGSGPLLSLQAGRGIAAVAVLLHHAGYATGLFIAALPAWLAEIFSRGALGVDFFFVLSGFIILNAHFDDPPAVAALRLYAFKRIIRIYVPYLPISMVLIASYFLLPDLSRNVREWGWLSSFLLIPSSHPPALAAAWTLVHEMLFYTIFVLYFVNRKIFIGAIIAWSGTLLLYPAVYVQDGQSGEPLTTALLNPINLEFCFGLACALGYRLISPRYSAGFIVIGLCILLLFFAAFGDNAIRNFGDKSHIVFGLGIALLILGVTLREKGPGLSVPKILVRLGDASYAIYLIHVPVISLTVRLATRLPLLNTWFGALCFLSACAITAGYAYYWLYERPALAAIRKVVYRPNSGAAAASPLSVTPP
jgi:exopolysaccharide production protein ExoZ